MEKLSQVAQKWALIYHLFSTYSTLHSSEVLKSDIWSFYLFNVQGCINISFIYNEDTGPHWPIMDRKTISVANCV